MRQVREYPAKSRQEFCVLNQWVRRDFWNGGVDSEGYAQEFARVPAWGILAEESVVA